MVYLSRDAENPEERQSAATWMERQLRAAACQAGNLQRVQELHGQGVSLTTANNNGVQPIHSATSAFHPSTPPPLRAAAKLAGHLAEHLLPAIR